MPILLVLLIAFGVTGCQKKRDPVGECSDPYLDYLDRQIPRYRNVSASSLPECDSAIYPLNPSNDQTLCPPYGNLSVFFVAHPDDEALGMAGAIRKSVLSGKTTIVELMTKGTASSARTVLCQTYNICLDSNEFGKARMSEFLESASRLGVSAVKINEFQDGALTEADIRPRIEFWISQPSDSIELHAIAGKGDFNYHPDHDAVAKALKKMNHPSSTWHLVYQFRNPPRDTPSIKVDISAYCDVKRSAMLAYRKWKPESELFGIGWLHSTPDLFKGACEDCSEYILLDQPD